MQVQKPIRYYITKRGDEPTVRSVAVTLDQGERDEGPDPGATVPLDQSPGEDEGRAAGVGRRVKAAIASKTKTQHERK